MTELKDSVILPREDFYELSTVAFDNHRVVPISERAAQVTQTSLVVGAIAAAAVGAAWGINKANDWLENRRYDRRVAEETLYADLRKK